MIGTRDTLYGLALRTGGWKFGDYVETRWVAKATAVLLFSLASAAPQQRLQVCNWLSVQLWRPLLSGDATG